MQEVFIGDLRILRLEDEISKKQDAGRFYWRLEDFRTENKNH